jgi:photosystem II stability/assembly factor-like uncharacterized protein
MKKILIISLFYLLLSKNNFGQDWININPTFEPPGNYNTWNGFFSDENNGWWIAGPNGYLWNTSNKGENFGRLIDSSDIAPFDLYFVDSLHGWIAGETMPDHQETILITKDGGKNWEKKESPMLNCLTFLDSLVGYGGGYYIYSTIDGGRSWLKQEIQDSLRALVLEDIFFIDKKNGWAVGGSSRYWDAGIILNTTNGGISWNVSQHPSAIYGNAVYFTDSLHGYIAGSILPSYSGAIEETSDGGKSWQTVDLGCLPLNDIIFTDTNTGWSAGYNGNLWKTTDRGTTWTKEETCTTNDLYNLFFFKNGTIGYIFGNNRTLLKYDKTVDVKQKTPSLTSTFKLYQNYPNPFNPTTRIDYEIPQSGFVSLIIYDLLGKEVRIILNEEKQPGSYSVTWDGNNEYGQKVSSGIYFYQLKVGSFFKTLKMILLK